MAKKKHIVIVTNLFPNEQEKEKGQFIYQLVQELKRNIQITVVSPIPFFPRFNVLRSHHNFKYAQLNTKEKRDGYDVFFCKHIVLPKLGFLRTYFLYFSLLKLLKKIDRSHQIDLLNGHWIFPDGVVTEWVGKTLNKPVVLTARGCDINHYPKLFGRKKQIVNALNSCDKIIAVSYALKKEIMSLGISEKKVFVIPNGIDFNRFHHIDRTICREKIGLENDDIIILSIGSLDEVKGTHYLIMAFGMLANKLKDIKLKLIIIGEGHLRSYLKDLCKEHSINDRVNFLGNFPHEKVPYILNASDMLCVASIREGRPNVVLEALSCGIPVVASNVGGIPELIKNGENGYLFERGNVSDLFEKINKCLSTSWLSENVSKTVKDLNWDNCANGYINVYESILLKK